MAGDGLFYRNSRWRCADITDGTSNTIAVGERSANHSPSTWTGTSSRNGVPPGWQRSPPCRMSRPPRHRHGQQDADNADFDEALVLGHGNYSHLPSADNPFYDPDTFYSMHAAKGANFLFCDGSVHFLSGNINPFTYQYMATIAGGEVFPSDW